MPMVRYWGNWLLEFCTFGSVPTIVAAMLFKHT